MNKELIKKAFQLGYRQALEKMAQNPSTKSIDEDASYAISPDSPAARRSAGVGKYSDNPDFAGQIDPATYFGQLEARLPAEHRYPYFGGGDERRQHIKDRIGTNAVSGIGPAAAFSVAYEGRALPHFSRDAFVNGAEAYDRPVTQADLAGLRAIQAGANALGIRSREDPEDLEAIAESLYRSGMINAETFRRTGKPLLRTEPDMYGLENLKRQLSDEEKAKLLQRQNIQSKAPVKALAGQPEQKTAGFAKKQAGIDTHQILDQAVMDGGARRKAFLAGLRNGIAAKRGIPAGVADVKPVAPLPSATRDAISNKTAPSAPAGVTTTPARGPILPAIMKLIRERKAQTVPTGV